MRTIRRLLKKLSGDRKHRTFGLALSGGAVLGAAHIGVLKALDDENIKIDYVSGTSIGAIVAALFAFGKKWQEVEEVLSSLNWLDVSRMSFSQLGILSNKKLADVLSTHIGESDFADAKIPLAVVATDITNGERVVLKTGDVAAAVMASSCIPGVFNPVVIDEKMLVDGSIVEKVPVSPLKEMGADFIIAVHLSTSQGTPRNIVDVLINAMNFSVIQRTKLQVQEADLVLDLDLSEYNWIDTKQVPKLIDEGYTQAKAILEDFSI